MRCKSESNMFDADERLSRWLLRQERREQMSDEARKPSRE